MGITHNEFMKMAITEAEKAQKKGEVPIGAVLVGDNEKVLAAERAIRSGAWRVRCIILLKIIASIIIRKSSKASVRQIAKSC